MKRTLLVHITFMFCLIAGNNLQAQDCSPKDCLTKINCSVKACSGVSTSATIMEISNLSNDKIQNCDTSCDPADCPDICKKLCPTKCTKAGIKSIINQDVQLKPTGASHVFAKVKTKGIQVEAVPVSLR